MLIIRRESLDIPQGRWILAVKAIHGHVQFLIKGAGKRPVCEADELIIDGDIIEKGPYSLETLRVCDGAWKTPNAPWISKMWTAGSLELIRSREPEMTRHWLNLYKRQRNGGEPAFSWIFAMKWDRVSTDRRGRQAPQRNGFRPMGGRSWNSCQGCLPSWKGQFYLCATAGFQMAGKRWKDRRPPGFKVRRFSNRG